MSKNLRLIASKIRKSERRRQNRSGVFTFYINRAYYNVITVTFPHQNAVDDAIYELASMDTPDWDVILDKDPKTFWDYFCSVVDKYGTVCIDE